MPNYVYAQLYVYGDKKELQKFKKFAEGEEEYYDDDTGIDNSLNWKLKTTKWILDMNKFIPYPKRFKEIDKKNKQYYDWVNTIRLKVKEEKSPLTKEEQKIINELALIELEGKQQQYRKDGFNSCGYEWCAHNWQTKWNFCNCELTDETDEELHYTFQTAWSIPMPVLIKMSKMFPKLEFNYLGDEESEEFEVDYHFKAGKITESEEKGWADIQIEKIKEGNIDGFDYDKKLYTELEKHKGHEIILGEEDKLKEFRCKTCNNKVIWDIK